MRSTFEIIASLGILLALAPRVVDAAPVHIKNGRSVNVVLGKTREAAVGIRPEKKAWPVELGAGLVGAEADLQDVTPDVAGARWVVPVVAPRLSLDEARFLPGHVYRLELRRERRLLGSVLVYLFPPPAARVSRIELDDGPEPPSDDGDAGFGPATVPKGRL
jgi:hypothetical protein